MESIPRTLNSREENEMNATGIQLACRYSFNCQHATHFGISERLKELSSGRLKEEGVARNLLEKLTSYRFFKVIAEINGIEDPFDPRVISYYWRGEPELEGELWHNFTTLLPIVRLPAEKISAEMVDECLIHSAVVSKTFPGKIVVNYFPVEIRNGKIAVAKKSKQKEVENVFLGGLKKNDIVTIHFSKVIERIGIIDVGTLTALTNRSLEKFNRLRVRKRI
ncbi:MAG: DUF6390 family protein [Candidatus Parcubacteria bacterium]|nr:DUF6390 family protein [Candidatus Parcubacteria bacterium]